MKNITTTLLLLLSVLLVEAQNIAPNPSFENYIICPSAIGDIYRCQNWSSFGRSPDYFNACSPNANIGVPSNYCGFQYAATGNAYCGIIPCSAPGVLNEYIGAQLLQPLTVGQKYFVSFKISYPGNSYCPTNKMGVRFSTIPFDSTHIPEANNIAHVYADTILSDTLNWFKIQGSFISDSNYMYLILGNFFNNVVGNCPQLTWTGYHYIDDVCVSTDSSTCYSLVSLEESIQDAPFRLFPNPFNEHLTIEFKNNQYTEVILYDVTSRKLIQQYFINSISVNTEGLAHGIYFYELSNERGVIKSGKMIKE